MRPAPRRFPPRLRHLSSLLFVTPPGSDDDNGDDDGDDDHDDDGDGDDDGKDDGDDDDLVEAKVLLE